MRKIEWKKSVNEVLMLQYVLVVDDRETTIKFEKADLDAELQKHGNKAKGNLIQEVRGIVSNPKKGLTTEEQNDILVKLDAVLQTVK